MYPDMCSSVCLACVCKKESKSSTVCRHFGSWQLTDVFVQKKLLYRQEVFEVLGSEI